MNKFAAIAGAIAIVVAAGASAQPKPDEVIEYRRSAMTIIGWNFQPLAAMVKGRVPFDAKEFARRAERIAQFAPQVMEGFAKGSDKGAVTDAKADIWTHYDDFRSKFDDFVGAAKALGETANGGDEVKMKEQFRKLGGTCHGCHEKYKAD